MPTRQTAVTYLLTVTDTHGHQYCSVNGSLLHCLEIMGDRCYCFKDAVDTYSRIRRELVASGGAYSRFFPTSENDGLPIHVVIINEALLPAPEPAPRYVEPVAPRGPLLPSVQKVIDALPTSADVLARREVSPDFHPVECASCKQPFLQNKLFNNRVCAACLSGERSSVPLPNELATTPVKVDYYRIKAYSISPINGKKMRSNDVVTASSEEDARRIWRKANGPTAVIDSVKRARFN